MQLYYRHPGWKNTKYKAAPVVVSDDLITKLLKFWKENHKND
jgi:hypothetical protein